MRAALLLALLAAPGPSWAGAAAPRPRPGAPEKAVRLEWSYRGVPAALMSVHELAEKARSLPLWRTGTAARFEQVPAGPELPGGVVRLRAGGRKRFLLVLRNEGKGPVRFFAAPHHAEPDEASLGFEFACLCRNHVYEAAPGGWWWRVVELTLDPSASGDELVIRHALVAAPKGR